MLDNTQPGIVMWHCHVWFGIIDDLSRFGCFDFIIYCAYCDKQSPFCRAMSVSSCQACTIKSKQTDPRQVIHMKIVQFSLRCLEIVCIYNIFKTVRQLCIFKKFFLTQDNPEDRQGSTCLKVFFHSKQQNLRNAKK